MNESVVRLGMTYKEVSAISGVPQTTVSNYSRAKVDEPNLDYCVRIAAAFGDPPDVVHDMRKNALPATAKQNQIIAGSDDKERMEQMASVLREHMVRLLAEYQESSASQQTEIIQHADRCVEQERVRCAQELDAVTRRCAEEVAAVREREQEKTALLRERASVVAAERDRTCAKCSAAHDETTAHLMRTVRLLTRAIISLAAVSIVLLSLLGGYASYAYVSFDRADPTRGLYQTDETPEPDAAIEEDAEGESL